MRAAVAQRVLAAMPQIELVLAIGQYAQAWHLGGQRRENMTETVRAWQSILFAQPAPAVLPLPHPSWRNSAGSRRNPWFERELLPTLRQRIKMLVN
jgi:uracil-DNA glycosylase